MKDVASDRRRLAVGCALVLGALALAAPAVAAGDERIEDEPPRVRVTVRVWDRGDFDAIVLRSAEAIVDHIFSRARVTVSWRHCMAGASEYGNPCMQPQGPNEASVRVTPHHATAANPGEQLQGGCAVRLGRWPGSGFVYVYKDRILEVSRTGEIPAAVVLGTVITHEIGHLLLPRGHSGSGIMRGQVDLREWVLAEQGSLLFTPEQSTVLSQSRPKPSSAERRIVWAVPDPLDSMADPLSDFGSSRSTMAGRDVAR